MKKQIMKGMTVLFACAAFVSCSHDLSVDETAVVENLKNEYKANFIKKYGEIDPNQSWDFTGYSSMTRGAETVQSIQKQEGANFYGYCYVDTKAMKDLLSGSSTSYDITFDRVKYHVTGTASDITFNPYFSAKITPSFARIDEFNATTYRYYHLHFTWGNNQDKEMISNISVVGRSGGEYWYDGKNNGTVIHRTSRLTNTLPAVGASGNWYAYYTNKTDNTKYNYVPVTTVREFKITATTTKGETFERTYWGFDCDGAENGLVDLICLVNDYSIPNPIIKRYMIEDLGSTGDTDFNDVVVDFKDDQLGHQTAIIRAMGGTLDFTLNVAGNAVWTKSVNGPQLTPAVNVEDMANTDPADTEFNKALATISISGWNPDENNISVTVTYKDETTKTGNTFYTIPFPEVGQVPMMIATDPSVLWMYERVDFPTWWLETHPDENDD